MNYRWTFREYADEDTIHNLAESLKIPKTLAKVLAVRGVLTKPEAEKFFQPSLDDIHDPFLMLDMDKASDRIMKAVENGEGIWIHGDYDVDGTSSTASLLQFLRELGGTVDFFIPDRFQDGYGISKRSIDDAKAKNCTLLISVDVGVTNIEPVKYANSLGMEVVICDHHEPTDTLPDAYAILDPIRPNCNYPFKYLAACGVVFKLIQAICIKLGTPDRALDYLDFVALASIADMVPLLGENRAFVHFGLIRLNVNTRPGFKGLLHCTRLKIGQINASNIVFAVAPIINAAGRMGDAIRSVEMMIQKDEISAFHIAQQLEDENRKRRVFDLQTFEEAIPLAQKQVDDGAHCLVIHNPTWHPGVIGIVASRLVDRFNMPTVLMTTIEGHAKGSARSIKNFDVHAGLKAASHLLIEYGGHKHAAGLSLDEDKIPAFKVIFDGMAVEKLSVDMLHPEIIIDSELKLTELTPHFFKSLNQFAPYGYNNFKPVFFSKSVKSQNGIKIVGNNIIKFRAMQNNFVIDAIGYNLIEKFSICSSGKPFSILYNLEMNSFNGQNTPQLYLRDIKVDDE
ncbi:MAG: single-stranded-DNA-specific exonuclease RecJ [Candidatus Kapabacteria bacterium]|nr:single-stranded-DNA-specific exonuclease RecJ [Candidatus Kapabacteria bacterium]